MWNARHALISSRCSWCTRVWNGKAWVPDRRPPGGEIYAHGICPDCASTHFAETHERGQMNVVRFRMKAS